MRRWHSWFARGVLPLALPMAGLCLAEGGVEPKDSTTQVSSLSAASLKSTAMPAVMAMASLDGTELVFSSDSLTVIKRLKVVGRSSKIPSRVGDIRTLSHRNSFLVVLRDAPEIWEVSFDPRAPEIPMGMVHDFRYGEGDFVPGYLNPRRIDLPSPALAITMCPSGHEVLTSHAERAASLGMQFRLVHLDVRRSTAESTCPLEVQSQ